MDGQATGGRVGPIEPMNNLTRPNTDVLRTEFLPCTNDERGGGAPACGWHARQDHLVRLAHLPCHLDRRPDGVEIEGTHAARNENEVRTSHDALNEIINRRRGINYNDPVPGLLRPDHGVKFASSANRMKLRRVLRPLLESIR